MAHFHFIISDKFTAVSMSSGDGAVQSTDRSSRTHSDCLTVIISRPRRPSETDSRCLHKEGKRDDNENPK